MSAFDKDRLLDFISKMEHDDEDLYDPGYTNCRDHLLSENHELVHDERCTACKLRELAGIPLPRA